MPEVLDKLNNEWNYKTKKRKKCGGKELSRSAMYRIFTNPFYAGIIHYGGKESRGKHKPMITLEQYDNIQTILGRDGKPRRQAQDFPYRGLIKCKECGCIITADFKHKFIKSTKEVRTYSYYYCAHRRRDYACHQPSVDKEDMDSQVINELKKYDLKIEFLDLALEIINEIKGEETTRDEAVKLNVDKSLAKLKSELKNLTKMKCRELLSDDEYIESKNELTSELNRLQTTDVSESKKEEAILKLTRETFELACNGLNEFLKGDSDKRRNIFSTLGSNFFLKNKKLEILVYKWLLPIKKVQNTLNAKIGAFEPWEMPINKGRSELLSLLRPCVRWRCPEV